MNADEAMDAAQRVQTICHTYNSVANAGFEATDHSTRVIVCDLLPFGPFDEDKDLSVWDGLYDFVEESMK